MVLNTLTVGAAVTPTVLKTYGQHYLGDRKSRHQKPTAHISYDEGLHLIRRFLQHASHHTVEELQAFTAQWVPSPRWVRTEDVTIPEATLTKAADTLVAQLGHKGVDRVGGKTWWQWRRDNKPLRAEWIEMRADHTRRKKAGEACKRVMLYVHGGAYFFGSVDEHRYQMQRHARKLKARVFAPRYRLAPQFPFPCGLLDCLAAYLYLLTVQDPSTILLAGDSAGGGMVMSLLVTLRDQGLPMPAGAILISPWVDLTHSFPSVAGSNERDYIPDTGFFQRPSAAWPPPNADEMKAISMDAVGQLAQADLPRRSTQVEREKARDEAVQGFSVTPASPTSPQQQHHHHLAPNEASHAGGAGRTSTSSMRPADATGLDAATGALSLEIDGQLVELKDQIQMYTTNQLLAHPLVSPILQPSLGGLPPLLIQVGGGEMLRDEQIYLAHKAANPAKYPPPDSVARDFAGGAAHVAAALAQHPPTEVQLQVWDDLCHVAPTLSFTRPAKFMYRSIAQFGAWALAHAQRAEIEILDDDDVSVISTGSDTGSDSDDDDDNDANGSAAAAAARKPRTRQPSSVHEGGLAPPGGHATVGIAGDPLPPFKGHMIRQRIDRHGVIHPLGPLHALPALQMAPNDIGSVKVGTVRKWLAAKAAWDHKWAKEKRAVQKRRTRDLAKGFHRFGNDEVPPPSALAGRISANMPKEHRIKRSLGMSLWSLWGSSHDKETLERESQAAKAPEVTVASPTMSTRRQQQRRHSKGSTSRHHHLLRGGGGADAAAHSRSRSHVRDLGQADHQEDGDADIDENTSAAELYRRRTGGLGGPMGAGTGTGAGPPAGSLSPDFVRVPPKQPADSTQPPQQQEQQQKQPELLLPGTNVTLDHPDARRPKAGPVAFPFKLGHHLGPDAEAGGANASTITLQSQHMVTPSVEVDEKEKDKMMEQSQMPPTTQAGHGLGIGFAP